MPRFQYRALDASGRIVVGSLEASSNQAVLRELEKISILPIEISDERQPKQAGGSSFFARAPSREEITGLTRDLATLIKGGVTLDRALLILSETGRPAISKLMVALNEGISTGKSLAEVLSAYPAIFPRTYVKMVEVAEAAGNLDETLEVIAHERSRGEALRRRITSALTYPGFLTFAAVGVLIFVLTAIIPEFEQALAGLQGNMQGSTQTAFAMSRWLRENGTLLAGAAAVVLLGGLLASRNRAVKSFFMQLLGRLPVIKDVVQYEQTVVFCATLGALSASGVDISSALRLIRDLMRDKRSQAKLDQIVTSVRQGHRLSDSLRDVKLLPIYAVHMLRVGEESGELDTISMRIAGFYEGKLDRALGRLTSTLGPVIMILVSLLIAWLIVSVITALLSVNELIL